MFKVNAVIGVYFAARGFYKVLISKPKSKLLWNDVPPYGIRADSAKGRHKYNGVGYEWAVIGWEPIQLRAVIIG